VSDIHYTTVGDGCRLAYRFDGDADRPVLILSNSIATDHRMWDRQIAELTKPFRVLRYDTRGHGGSDAPAGAYSLDRLGRDVIELMDALDIEPFPWRLRRPVAGFARARPDRAANPLEHVAISWPLTALGRTHRARPA
jgi:pimeloyl-ACP methyl ester carboxylesterase